MVRKVKTILIMGLPGSGKTFLADTLYKTLEKFGHQTVWFNADRIRTQYNDWDFSPEGRKRQMNRMKLLSEESKIAGNFVICDFVCPTKQLRQEFAADFVIWMNTIRSGRFEDTNKVFETLEETEYSVSITDDTWWTSEHATTWTEEIIKRIVPQNEV